MPPGAKRIDTTAMPTEAGKSTANAPRVIPPGLTRVISFQFVFEDSESRLFIVVWVLTIKAFD